MKTFVNLAVVDRIDFLTRLQATRSPVSLACRLGISISTLNEYIVYMRRTLKAPIRYNKYAQSYYYEYLPDFYLGFEKDRSNPQIQYQELNNHKHVILDKFSNCKPLE